ncbi:MAG TPA: HAMP domain-containing sensor histidine kinase [Gemmataceae bacterium]|nr:HAMP domain-containing sensor histidine kinase [Gemmataceae bacterium]
MSLTTRLSTCFLTALALVLLGFSTVLFLLVYHHLADQTNQRLEAAMQTLVATIEVHPNDVEWEPLERHVTLGEDPGEDQVRWMVHDSSGHLVDCSRNFEAEQARNAQGWRMLSRRVRAGNFDPEVIGEAGANADLSEGIAADQLPGQVVLPPDRAARASAFTIRVALAWQPVVASLRQLAWTLASVSAGLWGVGVLLSRRVCRRALHPVVQMASSARVLRAEETGQFLTVAHTGDELEDLGRAFNDVLTRFREVLERQQRFTGDASHQLRTPLTAILGQVEVALRQERSSSEYQRVLELVRRRAGEMRETVELLLFLARMPAKTELPEMRIVNLLDWLEQRLRPWADHPRFPDMQWPKPADTTNWEVRTQPALLGQVFENLLDNACKYSEAGTPIIIQIEQAWRGVMLSVSDCGHGIRDEELPHLCDPFYRSAEARRLGRPGVGLGLTVVGRIVKVLGGELHIDSTSGQGSRFSVYLPAVSERFVQALLDQGPETRRDSVEGVEDADFGPIPGATQTGANGVGAATSENFSVGRGVQ